MTDDAASLRIERNPPDLPGRIILRDGDKDVLIVPPGQNSSVILDPGAYSFRLIFEVSDGHADLPELVIEPRGRITMLLSLPPPTPLQKMMKQTPVADLKIIIDEPRPWPTHTAQFWVGYAEDSAAFWAMFGEREFPVPQTDEVQWAQDDTPISLFAQTQGELYIDHDFTEGAYLGDNGPWLDRLHGHSWSEFWAEEVLNRAIKSGHPAPNAFFFCGYGKGPKGDLKPGIKHPKDIDTDKVRMAYIGTVTHRTE